MTGSTAKARRLADDLCVGAPGLGCVGLSGVYGTTGDEQSVETIRRALDLGTNFLDTADDYGPPNQHEGHNEELIARAIAGRRADVVLATKFSTRVVHTSWEGGGPTLETVVDGSPENVRVCCEASLRRLGTDYIDVYFMHRIDPKVPIEETVGAMGELAQAGKIRHVGLCEVAPRTLERAHAEHPIAALQSEWSLWSRDIEDEVLPLARRLGIGIVPYAPLGRGFLTGAIRSPDDLPPNDIRRSMPRFQGANFAVNLDLVDEISAMAAAKGCTAAQLALAWLMAQGDDVVPIPGSRTCTEVEDNAGARDVALTIEELRLLSTDRFGAVAGQRYAKGGAYGESPERPSAT